MSTFDYDAEHTEPPVSEAPEHAIWIGSTLGQNIDRQLGYRGERRYVLFYFEPRGEEIIWQDCDSYGFGLGGWRAFMDEVEPVLEQYDISIGNLRSQGRHALIIDRTLNQAYLAPRKAAERFVLEQIET